MHTGINNSKIEFEDAFKKKPLFFIWTKQIMSFLSLQWMCCRVFSKIWKIKRNIFSTLFQTKTTTKSQIYLLEKTSEKGENNRGKNEELHVLGDWFVFSYLQRQKRSKTKYAVLIMQQCVLSYEVCTEWHSTIKWPFIKTKKNQICTFLEDGGRSRSRPKPSFQTNNYVRSKLSNYRNYQFWTRYGNIYALPFICIDQINAKAPKKCNH